MRANENEETHGVASVKFDQVICLTALIKVAGRLGSNGWRDQEGPSATVI